MRILVTGGAGFIGSHLVERLLADGHTVRVLDNLSTGKSSNLPHHERLDVLVGDVRDSPTVMRAAEGIDAIFHLAAVASVQASIDDPIGTHGSNLIGTLNLLDAARRYAVPRFLYASSAAVYGDTAELPVGEHAVLAPLSPYAADKLAGEHYLSFYLKKFGIKGTAFRFFNIYGPRQDPTSPYSGVISIFIERLRNAAGVTIFGDGRQTRDFVYVGDLVRVLTASLAEESTVGRVFNVGRGVECSLLELLDALEQLTGRKIERRHEPPRVGDIARSRADVTQLRSALRQIPSTPLSEGLGHLLRYVRVID